MDTNEEKASRLAWRVGLLAFCKATIGSPISGPENGPLKPRRQRTPVGCKPISLLGRKGLGNFS
jgi:hypothetical protein